MNTKKWLFLALTALLIITSSLPGMAQESASIEDVVTSFYDWYLGYFYQSDDFRNPIVEGAYRENEFLTAGLIEAIDNQVVSAGDRGIGHDPFLCAQDLPSLYQFDVVDNDGEQALVLLREYFGTPRSNNVTLTLAQTDSGWKIADVVCGDTLTPRGVAQDFYTWYMNQAQQLMQSGEGNILTIGAYREYPYLSEALQASIDTSVASMGPGSGDPFLCAQDIPQGVWISDVDGRESSATVLVEAHFQGNPKAHHLVVQLEKPDQQWLLTTITCGLEPEILAQLLYKEYAEQIRYNMDNNIEMDILRNPVYHWNRYVSVDLLDRLVAASEADLMADPVLCAQDIPERFAAEVLDANDSAATVQMSGLYPSGPGSYSTYPLTNIRLDRIDGQWQLTDIACNG